MNENAVAEIKKECTKNMKVLGKAPLIVLYMADIFLWIESARLVATVEIIMPSAYPLIKECSEDEKRKCVTMMYGMLCVGNHM